MTASYKRKFSDEAVALSELVNQWEVENAHSLDEQAELRVLQKRMAVRQIKMTSLVDAANEIIQSIAKNGGPTYTVNDLL